ncbi:putative dynactin subunit 5 protein [Lasiodiplodia theobromae]|nr:putative dynactin subunit 5 protein [Lasiodiplodia theobromae]
MSRPTAARKAPKGEYIETDSGNKVSRKAHISGTANITLGGKTVIMADVHLRGDLHRLKTSHTSSDATGEGGNRGQLSYYPMKIGDNVFVGAGSHISAASISSHVHVGEGCILEPFCIVRDNVKILPRSVVPANMVIPSNSIAGGRPARVVGELGEGWGVAAGGGGGGEGGPMGQGEVWVEGGDLRELVRSVK